MVGDSTENDDDWSAVEHKEEEFTVAANHLLNFQITGLTADMNKLISHKSNEQMSNELRWRVHLICNSDNAENPGYVSLYIYLRKPIENIAAHCNFKIVPCDIVGVNRPAIDSFSVDMEFKVGENLGYGHDKVALLTDLLNPEFGFVHDGILRIAMQLTVFGMQRQASVIALTFARELKSRYNDGIFSDLLISVGTKPVASFHVHKIILCIHSTSFRDMLINGTKERKLKVIKINDKFSEDTVVKMLSFMYWPMIGPSFSINNSPENLLSIAHFYGVNALINICEMHMITMLSVDNAIDALKAAEKYKCDKLKLAAMTYIVENTLTLIRAASSIATLGEALWADMLLFMTRNYQIAKKVRNQVVIEISEE